MHLTDRQLDRFFDLLDGLIVFANGRLNLVAGLRLPIVGEEAEMKAAYVCDTMWRHTEVVEEYVRLNPDRLNAADRNAVAAWVDALVGQFTLVRFERGRAILMNDAGLFAVAGMDEDPEVRMPQCPDMLVATLLPFEGLIVSDGLMYGDGIPFNADETADMKAKLAELEPDGVAWTADELVERARAYNGQLREREFDELMSSIELEARQAREGERLPEGFHRGALAGLPADERARRVDAHLAELTANGTSIFEKRLAGLSAEAEPSESLEDCLVACLKRDELVDLCKALHVKRYGSQNKRGIAAMLVEPLAQAQDELEQDLLECSQPAFDQFERLVKAGGRLEVPIDGLDVSTLPEPLPPYSFQFRHGGKLTTVIPRELRDLAARPDLAQVSYVRQQEDAIANCADTMGCLYGLLTLREAYDLYRGAVVDACRLDEFVALLMREDSYDDRGFVLQQWHDDSYLMHYSVGDAHLREVVMKRFQPQIEQNVSALMREGLDGPTMKRVMKQAAEELAAESAELDAYRAHVVEVRAHVPRRPLDASAAEGTAIDRYLELPALVQLRDFYDAHVPDGEDDYTFADRAVEDLVSHAIEMGNVDAYLDGLEQAGWNRCAEDERLLPRLAENAYGALPSWEFNGWSPQEVLENMSGRKVFYNARGELLHPAAGDPCPCGSGKPYAECHGKDRG